MRQIDRADRLDRLIGLMTGDEKHTAAATSTLDVIQVLYERILDVSPATVGDVRRDRFLLSKGHGPMAYYAVLADRGFFPEEWLAGWAAYDSPLGHHPDRNLVPGVEISSGSLGHGLPLAVGTALGLDALTVVVIDNRSSSYAVAGRIERRFAVEGWHAVTVDGRDHDVLEKALSHREIGRPNAVVATVEEKY